MTKLASLALVLGLTAGCMQDVGGGTNGGTNGDDIGDGTGDGTGDDPTDDGTPPLDTAATYQLVSPIDLTVAAVLPQPAYDYLTILQDLRDDPAGAFFDLLEDTGGPAVTVIRDALPDALEDRLQGWINDYVADALFEDGPVADELNALLATAETVLGRADLMSELVVPATDADGNALAVHRLRAVRFHVAGQSLDVAVPAADLPLVETSAAVSISLAADDDAVGTADAQLALANHAFGLPYGEYAWLALELASQERYGVSVRAALGQMIDCPALAASVGDHCFLSVCVGHEAALQTLCEDGLDAVVARLHAEFAAIRFDAVRFHSGLASMWDAPADGAARDGHVDRITDGVWDATIDVGLGDREVPATFTGTRLAP